MSFLADITPDVFYFVAWAGIALWMFFVLLGAGALTKPSFWPRLKEHMQKFSVLYAAILALIAMVSSLWLSLIAGYTPCVLCSYQRIALYPIIVVCGFGFFQRVNVRAMTITLSGIGALIAGYHYALQRLVFVQQLAPCQADASCASMYLGYFGWFSIPLMAFTIAVAILLLAIFFFPKSTKRKKR